MEDFGYKKINSNIQLSRFVKRSLMIGATFFSIGCFLYITISAYHYVHNIDEKNIEIIKSPSRPIKVFAKYNKIEKKDNKVVYQDIIEKKTFDNVEKSKIVPIAELPKPEKLSKITAISQQPQIKQQSQKKKKVTNSQKIIVYNNISKDLKQDSKAVRKILNSDSDKKRAIQAKERLNNSKSKAITVQIAALTSYETAKNSWKNLKRLYPELFYKQRHYIKKANLGRRGVFYRLQIGDFYNQIKAEEFCYKYVLKSNKTNSDCIIVE
jgi:hypothetical protein